MLPQTPMATPSSRPRRRRWSARCARGACGAPAPTPTRRRRRTPPPRRAREKRLWRRRWAPCGTRSPGTSPSASSRRLCSRRHPATPQSSRRGAGKAPLRRAAACLTKTRKPSKHSRRFLARKPCCAPSAAITRTSRLCALWSEICPRRRACTVGWTRPDRFCTWERRRTCARERAGTSPRRCSARPRGTEVCSPERAASTPCSPPGANATRFYWKRA